jgi:hypothetical protein
LYTGLNIFQYNKKLTKFDLRFLPQHPLSPPERGPATVNPGPILSYTTLPRNLNNAQARGGIKLVPFRPINKGLPLHEGNEMQMVNQMNYLELVNSWATKLPHFYKYNKLVVKIPTKITSIVSQSCWTSSFIQLEDWSFYLFQFFLISLYHRSKSGSLLFIKSTRFMRNNLLPVISNKKFSEEFRPEFK